MDVTLKISEQDKSLIHSLQIETQVLNNLLAERKKRLNDVASRVLSSLTASPGSYQLKMNTNGDKWELELKPGALVIPDLNRETRRQALRN